MNHLIQVFILIREGKIVFQALILRLKQELYQYHGFKKFLIKTKGL